jgi:hypothetical protein
VEGEADDLLDLEGGLDDAEDPRGFRWKRPAGAAQPPRAAPRPAARQGAACRSSPPPRRPPPTFDMISRLQMREASISDSASFWGISTTCLTWGRVRGFRG